MTKFILIIFTFFIFSHATTFAADMGIPLQLKLKNPAGDYPTESGLTFRILVLSPVSSCILRDEVFSAQTITNGAVNLVLGSGSAGPQDPSLTLNQVYNNAVAKSGLSCVDANNNIVSSGQIYTPSSLDHRVIRVITVIASDTILVNFNMRSVPYAIQAESVAGKAGADILVRNTGTQLTQTNLESLLLDATRLTNLQNLAQFNTAGSATNFSGALTGDVTGGQGTTSVDRIKGIPVSATAPVSGQVLQFNGTQYEPVTPAAATVTSVAGRTGAVVLSSSDISGLGTAAGLNAGTTAGDLVQLDGTSKIPAALLPNTVLTSSSVLAGDVSGTIAANNVVSVGGKTSSQISTAVDDVVAATSANTASAIVKRDGSGNIAVNNVSSSSLSSNNLYLYNAGTPIRVRAPVGITASYDITLPIDAGISGQVLQTDGSGNLTWTTPSAASGTVISVTASAPLASSGGTSPNITLTQASSSAAGFLSSSDWSAFNSKQNALGFTPLNAASNLSDLGSAGTARSNLGLGSAAVLNAGVSAGNLVQLDGGAKIDASLLPNSVLTSSSVLAGDVSGTAGATSVVAVGGKTSAQVSTVVDDVLAATTSNTANTIVKRNASGDVTVASLAATEVVSADVLATDISTTTITTNDASANNLYLRQGANTLNLKAPASLASNIVLNLPNSVGTNGQVLQTDGSGNLSWVTTGVASGTVTSVTASAPLSSSGGATPHITMTQASSSAAGYLSSADWTTFNNKQNALGYTPLNVASNLSDLSSAATARTNLGLGGAAVLNVGTASGTVAAGDDSRITGALQSSAYATDVTGASACTSTQTSYWNTVSDAWACQNISFPNLVGDVSGTAGANNVVSVGGKSSAQISTAVDDVVAATSANTANTIVKRSASGDVSVAQVSATNATFDQIYLRQGANTLNLKTSASQSSNVVLTLPADAGTNGQLLQTDGAGNLSWITSSGGAGVAAVNASAPLSSTGGVSPTISISQASSSAAGYLSSADWTTFNNKQNALGYTPLNAASNLSDLSSAATARTNLGLGGAAVLNIGTAAGTVAAGDDSRITGALQSSAYATDVAGASGCTVTQTSYWNTVSDAWACQNITFPVTSVAGRTGDVVLSSSDISGLGTAASLNVGVLAGEVVQLDGSARIPASTLPANALTTTSAFAGDVSGTNSTISVERIRGISVSATAPTTGQALVYNGTDWVPTTGFPSFSRKTADQTFNVTGVVDVTGLSFAVTAGKTYRYKFNVVYTSAATTTGMRLGLTYPTVSMAVALANISSGADGTGAYYQGTINTSGDSVMATATSSTSANGHIAFVEGVIVPTANGTVQLRAASETGGVNIVIKANSFVEITEVP